MSVVQHFPESEKKSAVSVLMQLKSGGILEWYHYYHQYYLHQLMLLLLLLRVSLKGSKKISASIRISEINFVIWGRAGIIHHHHHHIVFVIIINNTTIIIIINITIN